MGIILFFFGISVQFNTRSDTSEISNQSLFPNHNHTWMLTSTQFTSRKQIFRINPHDTNVTFPPTNCEFCCQMVSYII